MKSLFARPGTLVLVGAAAVLATGASGCSEKGIQAQPASSSTTGSAAAPELSVPLRSTMLAATNAPDAGAAPTKQCSGNTLTLGPIVPGDLASGLNQQDFNCYAWQELIGLDWPSAFPNGGPPSVFGDPADTGPVTWETYMDIDELFTADGSPPPSWGTPPTIPAACQKLQDKATGPARRTRALAMSAKFSELIQSSSSAQATAPPNWLGAQNGTNLWYEVKVDQDEYNYIVQNKLYSADGQTAFYAQGPSARITLPPGVMKFGQTTTLGAIELKAAWMVVTDPTNAKWTRYKKTSAFVYDATNDTCSAVTTALVGLHILHKTSSQPTWVWSTFEQVDNVQDPSINVGTPPAGYNLFNPSCAPQKETFPASCSPDGKTTSGTVACAANTQPPYNIGDGCPAPVPIQVARTTALDSDAQAINKLAQSFIRDQYSASVWQYYAVVNVIWSSSPPTQQPQNAPVSFTSPQPPSGAIANTTMETYAQSTRCLDCHTYASTADGSGHEADFSFALGHASSTKLQLARAAKKKAKIKAPKKP
ncbi:MAG: hypothetical protein U0441_08775 [Polyangiaceae bacterium]